MQQAFKRAMAGTAIENTQDGLLAPQTRKEIRCLWKENVENLYKQLTQYWKLNSKYHIEDGDTIWRVEFDAAALSSLNDDKTAGFDNIPAAALWKNSGPQVKELLLFKINSEILLRGTWPTTDHCYP